MASALLNDIEQTTFSTDLTSQINYLKNILKAEIGIVRLLHAPNKSYCPSELMRNHRLDIEIQLTDLSSSNQDQSAFSRLLQKIIAFFRNIFGLKPEPKKLNVAEHLPQLSQFFSCAMEHANSSSEQSGVAPMIRPGSTH
jgi:hypothetical protein